MKNIKRKCVGRWAGVTEHTDKRKSEKMKWIVRGKDNKEESEMVD